MHTPGPWAIHHDGKPLFGYWHIRQDPKDWDGHGYQAICTLPASKKGTHYGDMFQANAVLIAAAPDLLAALQQVESEMRAGLGSSYGETREQVRRAIAKATALSTHYASAPEGERE